MLSLVLPAHASRVSSRLKDALNIGASPVTSKTLLGVTDAFLTNNIIHGLKAAPVQTVPQNPVPVSHQGLAHFIHCASSGFLIDSCVSGMPCMCHLAKQQQNTIFSNIKGYKCRTSSVRQSTASGAGTVVLFSIVLGVV